MNRFLPPAAGHLSRRGNLLILAILSLAFTASAALTVLGLVNERARNARLSSREILARSADEAGIHRAISGIRQVGDLSGLAPPFDGHHGQEPAVGEVGPPEIDLETGSRTDPPRAPRDHFSELLGIAAALLFLAAMAIHASRRRRSPNPPH